MPLVFQLQNRRISSRWATAWIVAEILVFALVADAVGFGRAALLLIASSALGALLLRRLGRNALDGLNSPSQGRGVTEDGIVDGALAGLAAVLLIVPGFLTTLAGAVLSFSAIRKILGRRYGGWISKAQRSHAPAKASSVDLDPAEWTDAGDHEGPDERRLK
jgi:UPF0716 family protein affecting phage T7 exclusion